MQFIENRTFDEIAVGDAADLTRTFCREDVELFADLSGEVNPAHVDADFTHSGMFHDVIAHGMWGGALVSAVIGSELPGPGTGYVRQSLSYHRPVGIGDSVTVRVTVKAKRPETRRLLLDCLCTNQAGETVISGEVEVIAPEVKVRRPRAKLPEGHLHERGRRYRDLIEATRDLPPIRAAIVHPCDEASLKGALEAQREGLIEPVLVGPVAKIRAAAAAAGVDLGDIEIVDAPHSHAAAEAAVALARAGRVEALMKGALHTDEVMAPVVVAATGLRTERRISHVFALDVPHYPKPLFITDAVINIYPSLEDKRDIVQNAIDFCQAIGIACPKVAILSAVETVYPKIPSTVEAAALCKMAERAQITGGLVDGPLAFDNAVSKAAARVKNIRSEVAGDADILVAPDLEAGNMIAKQLIYLGGADAAGLVLGARVPIMLTSRSDGPLARIASCALAKRLVHRRVPGLP
ncbi:MAG TPA: bifunctional enoyl-CoA hydratase/phosphate acetyltransferase [Paracoccaceae bacterium]|nr:bifunctional enoyl-CoA hydratase/phosphate acetyltransferase [Paracoccaceae bacterium]